MAEGTAGSPQDTVRKLPHHEQLEFCVTRAKYRQGRRLTAVRVYTVNDESKYLIVNGVSAIKISQEAEMLCQRYGDVDYITLLPDYPHDDYTEVYLVKYRLLKNARFAKKQLDGKSFYGQVLQVCYAPELETVEETRDKLQDRRKAIAALTRHQQDPAALTHVPKRRAMPPSARRLINQLRPELRKDSMDRLHPRVEGSLVGGSAGGGQDQDQQQQQGDGTGDSPNTSYPSESCSLKRTFDEATITASMGEADLRNDSGTIIDGSLPVESGSTAHNNDKNSTEVRVKTRKKLKLFGNKSLMSYK